MQENIFCTYYDAVNAMLPIGITHKLIDFYSANEQFASSLLSVEELLVYEFLQKKGETAQKDIIDKLGVSEELLDRMLKSEALIKNSDSYQKMGDATQKWVRLHENYDAVKLTARQKEIVELLKDIWYI
jgi:Zn-dependent peptidase ImmA (M78 family)